MPNTLQRKWWLSIIFMVLVLAAMPLLTACGGGDADDEATSATSQATTTAGAQPTITQPPTTTPSGEPVKIGVINDWSGPAGLSGLLVDQALKVIEKQIEERGGILGGRTVEFIKYDNKSQVALSSAGAMKLILDDGVSVLTIGGTTGSQTVAVAEIAQEYDMLFVATTDTSNIDRNVTTSFVSGTPSIPARNAAQAEMILQLKPETVAILSMDEAAHRNQEKSLRRNMEAAGVEIVYSEFVQAGTRDMSPYLTRIKYVNPDVLFLSLDQEPTMMAAKQIMELGGLDGIQVTSESPALGAAKLKGTREWIVLTPWDPSSDYPASVKFVEDYQAIHRTMPNPNHLYFYNPIWLAVNAIELAGTDDPEAILKAARSGNLEFDTPMGMARVGTDGDPGLGFMMVQIQEGGELVSYP